MALPLCTTKNYTKIVFGYFEKLAIIKTIFKDELMKMKAEEAARVANLTKVRCRNFQPDKGKMQEFPT